jgi:hypothetical protein
MNPVVRRPVTIFFGAELQKSAKSTNSTGAQSGISTSLFSRIFLFVAFLTKYLFAFLLVHSLTISIEELCAGISTTDWGRE